MKSAILLIVALCGACTVPTEDDAAAGSEAVASTSAELRFGQSTTPNLKVFDLSAGSTRRFVHMLTSVSRPVGPCVRDAYGRCIGQNVEVSIYLNIKLEWYGNRSGKWQVAGESREITYDIDVDTGISGLGLPVNPNPIEWPTPSRHFSGSETRSSDLQIELSREEGIMYYSDPPPEWQVLVGGSISQQVKSDIWPDAPQFTNYGEPPYSSIFPAPDAFCPGGCWWGP